MFGVKKDILKEFSAVILNSARCLYCLLKQEKLQNGIDYSIPPIR